RSVAAAAIKALAMAPIVAPPMKTSRGDQISATLNRALKNAPTTKPICTDIVSQATPPEVRSQAVARAGVTAEAENQRLMPNNSAKDNKIKVCHFLSVIICSRRQV